MPLKYELPGLSIKAKEILSPYLNVYFGQFCEDVILAELIEKDILPRRGFYVDIGHITPLRSPIPHY